jgi:hypothetical protein
MPLQEFSFPKDGNQANLPPLSKLTPKLKFLIPMVDFSPPLPPPCSIISQVTRLRVAF